MDTLVGKFCNPDQDVNVKSLLTTHKVEAVCECKHLLSIEKLVHRGRDIPGSQV